MLWDRSVDPTLKLSCPSKAEFSYSFLQFMTHSCAVTCELCNILNSGYERQLCVMTVQLFLNHTKCKSMYFGWRPLLSSQIAGICIIYAGLFLSNRKWLCKSIYLRYCISFSFKFLLPSELLINVLITDIPALVSDPFHPSLSRLITRSIK